MSITLHGVLLQWVDYRRHLEVLLLTEAKNFNLSRDLHFNHFGLFHARQGLSPEAECAIAVVATVTQTEVFGALAFLAQVGE